MLKSLTVSLGEILAATSLAACGPSAVVPSMPTPQVSVAPPVAQKVTVTFKPGTNLDTAQVLVQNRVVLAEPRSPERV